MKMPAAVRIDFRKMLREHPQVLEHVRKKSEVNNLNRDELIKLADQLGINFLQKLSDDRNDDDARKFVLAASKDQNFGQPFTGQLEFPLETIVFGQSHTVNFLLKYEYTPDWQFYCPDQKRLKFRHLSLSAQLFSEAKTSERNEYKGHSSGQIDWRLVPDSMWDLIRPIIIDYVNLEIEKQAWHLDQERRQAAGLASGNPSKTRWSKSPLYNKLQNAKSSAEHELFDFKDNLDKRVMERIIDLEETRDKALSENVSKSEFLAIMSHEIRTPMTSIIGIADMLLDDNLNPSQRDKIEKLRSASQSLIPILNGILDFSKIQAGKLEFENVDFNIHKLIVDAVDLMNSKARAKGITLSLDADSNLASGFQSDPTRVRQILLNLLENAVKFTARGSVTLRVQVVSQQHENVTVRFEIIDTGIGIAEHMKDKLFESFSQMDASIARKYEGAGLGLAISKRLAELMGGEIGFNSIEGQGSTFWFTIVGKVSVSEIAVLKRESNVTDYTAIRSLRFLLAEDNALNQFVIREYLSRFGHVVEAVNDGRAAVEAARGGNYDLILMDIRMPKMDGLEATRAIRKELKGKAKIPIIGITAGAIAENHKLYFDAGINDCVAKPIDLRSLIKAINRALMEEVHVIPETG